MTTTRTDGLISTMGPYRVDALIGRGHMGEVYRAFDTRRSRAVALKVLAPELTDDPQYRTRLRRETEQVARLQDPHVIPIHDVGEIDGRLFLDMRLVDGVGLDTLIARGPLAPQRAIEIVTQVADALTEAHRSGVVHRDVKPSNILVTRLGFVYLVDFGIARTSTLAYTAPERIDGGTADHRSDIYSLACVLAECLSGRQPFDATSAPALMQAHLAADPPVPSAERVDLPPAMDDVIARGMAKDPGSRFESARDLAVAALQALQWNPVPARAAGVVAPAATASSNSAPTHGAPSNGAPTHGSRAGLVAPGGSTGRPARPSHAPAAPTRRSKLVPLLVGGALLFAVAAGLVGFLVRDSDAPAPAAGLSDTVTARSSAFTYSVESNYPVFVTYIDGDGNQVSETGVDSPWVKTVSTGDWADVTRPTLSAGSTSPAPDAVVTCTITDDQDRVIVTDSADSGLASALCFSMTR